MREPIIRVLFEHGKFQAESSDLTILALFYYAFGLPAFAAIKLIVPAFYSTHDTSTPVHIAAYTLVLNIVINVLCLRWFFPIFRNGGPAFATVASAYFNIVALFFVFRVRHGRLGSMDVVFSIARIALCAGVMGAFCWLALRFSHFSAYRAFFPRLGVLAALIGGASAIYLGLAWLFRCHEIAELYEIALHRDPETPNLAGLTP